MELADQALLDLIVKSSPEQPRDPKRVHRPRTAPGRRTPAGGSRAQRCDCRVCPACLENARWERIFQEKFADPNYYNQPLRRRSCLSF